MPFSGRPPRREPRTPSRFRGRTRNLALLLSLLAAPALAQQPAATHSPQVPPAAGTSVLSPASGNGAATAFPEGAQDLIDGWRTHSGDDLAWAQPRFDDRSWPVVSLDDLGAAEPGWRWFRLRVQLPPGHGHLHLLIDGGSGVYEVYVNGQKQQGPEIRSALAVSRPTEQVISLPELGSQMEIALRTHAPMLYTTWQLPLFLTAAVGTPEAIGNERQALQSQRLYSAVPAIAINLIVILAAIAAFALYRSQRTHPEYLWLGFYLLLLGTSYLAETCTMWGVGPVALNNFLADPLIYLFTIMQIQFTFSFAGKPIGPGWRAYEGLLLVPLLLNGLTAAGVMPSNAYLLVEGLIVLPAAVLLPILLLLWYRRGNREAGWLILPSLLPLAATSLLSVGTASLYFGWSFADALLNPIPVGPVSLQPTDVGDFLFVLAIAVVMFFRFTRVSRDQARTAAELDAAREIQQRLVPARLPSVAGYALEAAYFPAQEVGGDFYQILQQVDGSALIVVGDVSGKGLRAAMTSTLALGALRTLAAQDRSPAAVLAGLNGHVLEAQDAGFITCLCARVTPQGRVTLSNAGHLAPYRNGVELSLESGLPLGIVADAEYTEQTLSLAPGDRLTLLSDGVVEARARDGELFGFGRTQQISNQPAASIAEAARRFGQSDDITVLTLVRIEVSASVPVPHAAPLLEQA